jgi:hypothetical protein
MTSNAQQKPDVAYYDQYDPRKEEDLHVVENDFVDSQQGVTRRATSVTQAPVRKPVEQPTASYQDGALGDPSAHAQAIARLDLMNDTVSKLAREKVQLEQSFNEQEGYYAQRISNLEVSLEEAEAKIIELEKERDHLSEKLDIALGKHKVPTDGKSLGWIIVGIIVATLFIGTM